MVTLMQWAGVVLESLTRLNDELLLTLRRLTLRLQALVRHAERLSWRALLIQVVAQRSNQPQDDHAHHQQQQHQQQQQQQQQSALFSTTPPPSPIKPRQIRADDTTQSAVFIPPRLREHALKLPGKRKVLVLDLDETLIHSSTRRLNQDFDTRIEVTIDQQPCLFYVYRRPHLDEFLAQVSKWFEVVIFTASMEEYASPVIDWIDPKGLISRRFYRESCVSRDSQLFKNLSVIEPDLSRVFIIDNSPAVYSIVPDNAIPVESWYTDRCDQALIDLLPMLDALQYVDDVRSVLSLRSS